MPEMKIVKLGGSGLRVTELCMGTLAVSPLQANLPAEEGGRIIRLALCGGINFIDTAQGYKNYAHVRAGIRGMDRSRLVIATKSAARTASKIRAAFEEACSEIGVKRLDIFLLHAVTSTEDLQSRKEALKALTKLRSEGFIRAVGISTHNIEPLRAIIGRDDIEICHPIFNMSGLGIKDGTMSDMADVLAALHAEGKGVYAMKPLGGGHLAVRSVEAFEFLRRHDAVDAVAVGMKDECEIAFNLACFRGQEVTEAMKKSVSAIRRRMFVNQLCKKCGTCLDACDHDALNMGRERMMIDGEKCVLCGYCVPKCPEFAIRLL